MPSTRLTSLCGIERCDIPLERGSLATRYGILIDPCEGFDETTSTPLFKRVCSPSCKFANGEPIFDIDLYLERLAAL